MKTSPLGLTCGDPGGVGPEIVARSVLAANVPLVLYGDADYLCMLLSRSGVVADRVVVRDSVQGAWDVRSKPFAIVHTGSWSAEARAPRASAEGGQVQYECLTRALADAREGVIGGIVTGPMSKVAVTMAGHEFTGHTEFLAAGCGLAEDQVTMMFLGPRLRVALVTTHLAVREVPDAITAARVARSAIHLGAALWTLDAPAFARGREVWVTGLNPHAGEAGLFGDEDRLEIAAGVAAARTGAPYLSEEMILCGPVAAETAMRLAASGAISGVVTMMHDQATIASKVLDWGDAVNVTWGLPFIRTSVDHGVGYDAMKSGQVDPRGMQAALLLAQRLLAGL